MYHHYDFFLSFSLNVYVSDTDVSSLKKKEKKKKYIYIYINLIFFNALLYMQLKIKIFLKSIFSSKFIKFKIVGKVYI